MGKIIDFFIRILYKYDIEIAELQSILAKFSSIFILLGIFDFSRLERFILFIRHHEPLGIPVFCIIATLIASFHFYGLVKNNTKIRKVGSFFSILTWTFLATILIIKGAPIAFLLSSTFILSSSLVYLRLSGILSSSDESNKDDIRVSSLHNPPRFRLIGIPSRATNIKKRKKN